MIPKVRSVYVFVLLVAVSGCMAPVPFLLKDYQIGRSNSATIGNPMIRWAAGSRTPSTQFKDTTVVFKWGDRITSPDATLRELIYKGVIDNKMNCLYREYVMADFSWDGRYSALAKPVFFLDVTYDLAESRIITFQDFAIRIDDANQQTVEFTILSEPEMMNERRVRRQFSK